MWQVLVFADTPLYAHGYHLLRAIVTDPTLAYIDPGSGSMLLQAIAGGVAAGAVVAKVYWRRLRKFLRFGTREDEGSPS